MTTYITRAELEAINDAIPDVHGLNHLVVLCNAAIQHYRDSLAGVELPEPVAWLAEYGGDVFTADQLRQAIADALCVAEKETAELRLYKHNMALRYKGLNNMLKDALANHGL